MEFVLVRHGKAEKRGTRIIDGERELTTKGYAQMEKNAEGLARLLGENRAEYIILSSHLPRARQTAEIIAQRMKVEQVLDLEAIATGNWDLVYRECLRYGEKNCFIIVGHEPYLSMWAERLTGFPLPFKKGAAAGIRVLLEEGLPGTLEWFLQPSVLQQIG